MTEITWGSLSLVQLQALQAIEDNKDVDKSVWKSLQSMGLVAFDEGSDADYLTPLGRRIYDEARAARPTPITWKQLTADEKEALTAVKWGEVVDNPILSMRLIGMGLIEVNQLNGMLMLTNEGLVVLAQKSPTTKTVKLKTPSADGLYWEVMYTDGTWEGEEVSHE